MLHIYTIFLLLKNMYIYFVWIFIVLYSTAQCQPVALTSPAGGRARFYGDTVLVMKCFLMRNPVCCPDPRAINNGTWIWFLRGAPSCSSPGRNRRRNTCTAGSNR